MFRKFINWLFATYREEKQERIAKYRLVGTEERDGKTFALIQVIGKSTTLKMPVLEIDNEFSKNFPINQRWYLGVIHSFEARGLQKQIKDIPVSALYSYKSLPIIAMLFILSLLMANLAASKVARFHGIDFPAGIIFFPLTYIFDNILTEVYGYKQSRRVIWTGVLCNLIFMLGAKMVVLLPPSPYWHNQAAYALVIDSFPRIIAASIIGYFCGEFLNSYTIAKLKIYTAGKAYWLRLISSTVVGAGVDSVLFCFIAFAFLMPLKLILSVILVQYIIKVGYEIIALPLTYVVTGYLKRTEQVDHFDINTNFTPFSLSLEDKPSLIKKPFLVAVKSAP